jgi:hypothetical protein
MTATGQPGDSGAEEPDDITARDRRVPDPGETTMRNARIDRILALIDSVLETETYQVAPVVVPARTARATDQLAARGR